MENSLEKLHNIRTDLPEFSQGDTIIVEYRVVEGEKSRIQPFQGVVIGSKGRGINETVKVRRLFQGVGVERVFPLQSPLLKSIKVIRKGSVRRAKLYYLRTAKGKQSKIKEDKRQKAAAKPAETAPQGKE